MVRNLSFANFGIILAVSGLLSAPIGAVQPAPQSDPVIAALQSGEAAITRHDARSLMAAAIKLADIEAHPADADGVNLALIWAKQARAWGAKANPSPQWRGRMLGPGYRQITLAGGTQYRTRQIFTAGQKARVQAIGMPSGAFSLVIAEDGTDSATTPLCQRHGANGTLSCEWIPTYSGPNDIALSNKQAKSAKFYLLTY